MNHITQEHPRATALRCKERNAKWFGDRITFAFRPGSVDALRATVKALFQQHGFGEFVTEIPRPETLLKDEKSKGRKPGKRSRKADYISREFVSPNPDTPLAIHVTKVTGRDESGDDYTCLARVRIGKRDDGTGTIVPFAVARPPEGQTEFSDPVARERALSIANRVNHRLTHVVVGDVTSAIRKALESIGAMKSLGGGNNYWITAGSAERAHAFLEAIAKTLDMYYERDPKTSMGASHSKAMMAQAAQNSLEDQLKEMETELQKAIENAANPKLTKKGKPVKKTATLTHKKELVQSIGAKLTLWESVVEQRITKRLQAVRETLEQNFNTLLDSGSVSWIPELSDAEPTTPSSDEEPAPPTQRSPESDVPVAAAAPAAEEPFGWL